MPIAFDAAPAARLHSVTAGAGPVVACLHSSGSSSGQWRRLIEERQAVPPLRRLRLPRPWTQCRLRRRRVRTALASPRRCSTACRRRENRSTSSVTPMAARSPSTWPSAARALRVRHRVRARAVRAARSRFGRVRRDRFSGLRDRARRARRRAPRRRPPRSSTTGTGPDRGAASRPSSRTGSAPASFPLRGTSRRCSRIRCRSIACARCARRRSCSWRPSPRRRRAP